MFQRLPIDFRNSYCSYLLIILPRAFGKINFVYKLICCVHIEILLVGVSVRIFPQKAGALGCNNPRAPTENTLCFVLSPQCGFTVVGGEDFIEIGPPVTEYAPFDALILQLIEIKFGR